MGLFRKKDSGQGNEPASLLKEGFLFFGELVKVIVISLAIIIPIRYFLIQPFYVKGASMEPTFVDHQYLIVDELSYRIREPKRGEIVVFRYPLKPSEFFIKRIIGLPGETVRLENDNVFVRIDKGVEKIIKEPYLMGGEPLGKNMAVTLGENEYFLLGDNRDASLDSRVFGAVHERFITGRVIFVGWPLSEIGFYKAPSY